jgi:hypothetical protein
MNNHAPPPAGGSRESTLLLLIAALALAYGTLAIFMRHVEPTGPDVAASVEDVRSIPLPAGPRKYQ